MNRTLVIANKAYSSWSMRPWILLRQLGLDFEEIVIPMALPGSKQEMLRHSPTGKCPVLHDGDVTVWDSLAIIEYLAEFYAGLPIWPADPVARGVARSLAAEMHSSFLALRRACPMNMRRTPARLALDAGTEAAVAEDVARIEQSWREARQRFGAEGPYLFGAFSAADAMFAPVVNRFEVYDLDVGADTKTYMAAMKASAAWRDWQAGANAEPWVNSKYEMV